MGETIVEGLVWVSTSIAVSVVAYYTKEPMCLWGMVVPMVVSVFNRIQL